MKTQTYWKAIVVLPTYNEAENILGLVPCILAQDSRLQVLIVDDNSPDGTGHLADEMAAANGRIHVLHRKQKEGLGPAYIAGFRWALAHGADLIFEMDADFSHDPCHLSAFFKAIEEHDVVLGSRYVEGGGIKNWPLLRRLISLGGSMYARFFLGTHIRDLTGGFKCFRRHVMETIDLDHISASGYGFQIELTWRALRAGFSVHEIPIMFAERLRGQSKMNMAIVLEAMTMVPKLRFAPARAQRALEEMMAQPATAPHTLHVLQVIAEAPPITSGVAKVAAELRDGLVARGHRVDLLSSVDIPRWNVGEFRFSSFLFQWPRYMRKLDRYDVINIHAPAPTFTDLFLVLASRMGMSQRKARLVLTYHSEIDLPGPVWGPLSRLYSWGHKVMAGWMAGHTVVSTPSYARMIQRHVAPDRVTVVPWGVNVDLTQPAPVKPASQSLQVVFIGQMRPYKGLDVLLRAMAALPGVHLRIIGGGYHEAAYRQMVETLNIRNVRFMGRVADAEMHTTLHESHVLVLPSLTRAEAFGIVLLEAMSAGCVPISSNLPGVRDVTGQAGFTFPVGEHQALAHILAYLRDRPHVVEHHAGMARAKAASYSWRRTVDAYERIYRAVDCREEIGAAERRGVARQRAILNAFVKHLGADSGCIYAGTGTELQQLYRFGLAETHAWPDTIRMGEGLLGFVGTQKRTMLLPDEAEETYLADELETLGHAPALLSSFQDGDQEIVLCLGREAGRNAFKMSDEFWLMDMVRQLRHPGHRRRGAADQEMDLEIENTIEPFSHAYRDFRTVFVDA